jgi:hypothetical protein
VLKGWNYGTEPDEARRSIFNGYGETGDNFIDGLAASRLPLAGLFKPSAPWLYPAGQSMRVRSSLGAKR